MIANKLWKLQMLSCSLLFFQHLQQIACDHLPQCAWWLSNRSGLERMGFSEEASIFAAGAKASAAAIKQLDFSGTEIELGVGGGKGIDISASWRGCTRTQRARTILINALRSRGNSKKEGRKGSRLMNAFLQSAMDLLERTNVTREAENILHKPFLLSIHRGSVSVSGSFRQLSFFPDYLLLWQDREDFLLGPTSWLWRLTWDSAKVDPVIPNK